MSAWLLKATKHGDFEIYNSRRYVTITGHKLEHSPSEITNAIDCDKLRLLFDKPKQQTKAPPHDHNGHAIDDKAVLEKLFASANGVRVAALFDGNLSEHGDDHSAADLALYNHLAFYCGPNGYAQIDRMFRTSKLFREKWLRLDYRNRTIQVAIDGYTDFYQPRKSVGGTLSEHTQNVITNFIELENRFNHIPLG